MPHSKHELMPFRHAWRDPSTTVLGKRFPCCLWGRSAASLKHDADVPKKLGSWDVLKCKGNLSGLRLFFYLVPLFLRN